MPIGVLSSYAVFTENKNPMILLPISNKNMGFCGIA